MNKFTMMMVCAGLLSVSGIAPVSAAPPTFVQVVDGVDGGKNTKLAAKENWKKFKGQEVSWSGVVHQVDTKGSKEAVVYVADKSRPLYKGYNIKLITSELEKAASFKKGQTIRFKGYIDDFDSKDPGAVVELKSVQF
jgi:hypothetical protein